MANRPPIDQEKKARLENVIELTRQQMAYENARREKQKQITYYFVGIFLVGVILIYFVSGAESWTKFIVENILWTVVMIGVSKGYKKLKRGDF